MPYATIYMITSLFLFLHGEDNLVEGIANPVRKRIKIIMRFA